MKYLHTMIRVCNLEDSIRFYQDVLGMRLISREDYPEGKFTLAFRTSSTRVRKQKNEAQKWSVSQDQ